MADWLSAFKYAARGLRRQPTFLAVSLLTLALGIGATTAIFSVIKAVVLNPLPYDAPERIAVLWEVNPEGSQERVSVPTFEDWKREARSLRVGGRLPPGRLLVRRHRRSDERARRAGHARAVHGAEGAAPRSAAPSCPTRRWSAPTASSS